MKKIALLAALTAFSGYSMASATQAEAFNPSKMYIGAGFSKYDINGVDSTFAYEVVAGYNLDYKIDTDNRFLKMLDFAVESGYTFAEWELGSAYYGTKYTYEVSGLWGAGVVNLPFSERWTVGAKVGYDIGDADGLLYGVHGTYHAGSRVDFRLDYISRDGMDGSNINVIFKF